MRKNNDFWKVNNVVPLVALFVALTGSYAMLISRIAVLETKMDTLIGYSQQISAQHEKISSRISTMEAQISVLDNIEKIK